VVAVHEALNKLQKWDERQCRIVELRFFAGLNVEETAEAMSISPTTVKREFQMAKAWLYGELGKDISGANP
jgi:RNA polymerase sigma factor (sigma-70 family)